MVVKGVMAVQINLTNIFDFYRNTVSTEKGALKPIQVIGNSFEWTKARQLTDGSIDIIVVQALLDPHKWIKIDIRYNRVFGFG